MTREQRELANKLGYTLADLQCACRILGNKYATLEMIDEAQKTLKQYRDNYHHALVIGRGQIDELLEDAQ